MREALRNRNIDPPALTRRLDRLRFLSPIRHPIDHAISLQHFYRNGIPPYIRPGLSDLQLNSVLRYILGCHRDFLRYSSTCPDKFFWFTETEIGASLLKIKANRQIPPDRWSLSLARRRTNRFSQQETLRLPKNYA